MVGSGVVVGGGVVVRQLGGNSSCSLWEMLHGETVTYSWSNDILNLFICSGLCLPLGYVTRIVNSQSPSSLALFGRVTRAAHTVRGPRSPWLPSLYRHAVIV